MWSFLDMNKTKNTSDDFDFSFDFGKIDFDFDVGEAPIEENEKSPTPKELTDEIKNFRQKNKEFQATNDHETYLSVCFSCKEDKKRFLGNVNLGNEHTLIDGYELAKKMDIEPQRPAYELREPLDK